MTAREFRNDKTQIEIVVSASHKEEECHLLAGNSRILTFRSANLIYRAPRFPPALIEGPDFNRVILCDLKIAGS